MADHRDRSDTDAAGPDRRAFLSGATCVLAGGLGLVIVGPVLRMVDSPAGRQTVIGPRAPIDVGPLDELRVGPRWHRIDVIAPVVKDAWTSAHDVVLGAAYLRRPAADQVHALSGVCPHLGCPVGYSPAAGRFLCPCHKSEWDGDGKRLHGAAKRGLDPLPIKVEDGKLRLTWVTYKLDIAARERA